MHFERIKSIARNHQLALAIALTIAVACLMTAISLSLYVSSGTLQLDLSRPGYEAVRREIINPDKVSDFAPTGPIDQRALEEYQKRFDTQRKELDSISKFKGQGIDDASLLLSPRAAP